MGGYDAAIMLLIPIVPQPFIKPEAPMDRMLPAKSSGWIVRFSLVLLVGCSNSAATQQVLTTDADLHVERSNSDDSDFAGYVDDPVWSMAGWKVAQASGTWEDQGQPLIRRTPPVELESVDRSTTDEPQIRRLPPVESGEPEGGTEPIGQLPLDVVAEALPIRRLPAVSVGELLGVKAVHGVALQNRWSAAGVAMVSVEEQARAAIKQGYALAQKGALYSSRAEFIEALRAVAGSLDAHYGDSQHTTALLAALKAMEEADDFDASGDRVEVAVDVAATAESHRTNVLEGANIQDMSPVLAMQRYHAFAQQQLASATGGGPVGAEALYALGKVYMAFGQPSNRAERMYGPKAITYFSAALTVNPAHSHAANELGVLFARFGKWSEARDAFRQSVASEPLAESWHNLAVVHDQLGEAELAWQARQQAEIATAHPMRAATNAMVRWVDTRTFAAAGDPLAAAPQGPHAEAAVTDQREQDAEPVRTARNPLFPIKWPWK